MSSDETTCYSLVPTKTVELKKILLYTHVKQKISVSQPVTNCYPLFLSFDRIMTPKFARNTAPASEIKMQGRAEDCAH